MSLAIDSVLKKLQMNGERVTKVRQALLTLLLEQSAPLSAQDILAELKTRRLSVNKTTVYRQLTALQKYNLIHEVHFADRTMRYEMVVEDEHHHHLVCLQCKKIQDIHFPDDVARQEKIITAKKKFKVLHHSLEFFGLCQSCQRDAT